MRKRHQKYLTKVFEDFKKGIERGPKPQEIRQNFALRRMKAMAASGDAIKATFGAWLGGGIPQILVKYFQTSRKRVHEILDNLSHYASLLPGT